MFRLPRWLINVMCDVAYCVDDPLKEEKNTTTIILIMMMVMMMMLMLDGRKAGDCDRSWPQ